MSSPASSSSAGADQPPRDVVSALAAAMHATEPGLVTPAAVHHVLQALRERVHEALALVRSSRHELEQNGVTHLHQAHAKLAQVTSATEQATTNIMDSLDRAQSHVDALEAQHGDAGKADRDALRNELFAVMDALQFQDITAQQLAHAGALLQQLEARLVAIAGLLEGGGGEGLAPTLPERDAQSYDPNATTDAAGDRQAVADAAVQLRLGNRTPDSP